MASLNLRGSTFSAGRRAFMALLCLSTLLICHISADSGLSFLSLPSRFRIYLPERTSLCIFFIGFIGEYIVDPFRLELECDLSFWLPGRSVI